MKEQICSKTAFFIRLCRCLTGMIFRRFDYNGTFEIFGTMGTGTIIVKMAYSIQANSWINQYLK